MTDKAHERKDSKKNLNEDKVDKLLHPDHHKTQTAQFPAQQYSGLAQSRSPVYGQQTGLPTYGPTQSYLPTQSFAPTQQIQLPVQQSYLPTQQYQLPVQQSYVSQQYQIPVQQQVQYSTVGNLRDSIKGESTFEQVPYERTVIEYEAVERVEYVPVEKRVTDYYTVEHQVEHVPQVYYDTKVEYVPVERVEERVEYSPVTKQVVHYNQEAQQQVQYVPQQSYTTVVQQPQQYAQQSFTTSVLPQQQVQSSQWVQTGVPQQQVRSSNVQYGLPTQQFVGQSSQVFGGQSSYGQQVFGGQQLVGQGVQFGQQRVGNVGQQGMNLSGLKQGSRQSVANFQNRVL